MRMRKIVSIVFVLFLMAAVCMSSMVPVAAEPAETAVPVETAEPTRIPEEITAGIPDSNVYTYGAYVYSFVSVNTVSIVGPVNPLSGAIEIPSTLDGYGVVSIARDAFRDCTALTGVTFPSGLLEIGASAFDGCENLQEIYYRGTQDAWDAIAVAEGNECLANVQMIAADDALTEVPASTVVVENGDAEDVVVTPALDWSKEIIMFAALFLIFVFCMVGFAVLRKWHG